MILGKVWGSTSLVLKTPLLEVHRLIIQPNAFCSWHKHEFKWNAFIVCSGKLFIEVKKLDYDLIDISPLGPMDVTTVRPNEVHRFRTDTEPCEAFELYYPEELSADIIRESVGGIKEKDA